MTYTPSLRLRIDALTPLNVATNARYAACNPKWGKHPTRDNAALLAGHVLTGRYVVRSFHSVARAVPLCRRCGVPVVGRVTKYSNTINFGDAA